MRGVAVVVRPSRRARSATMAEALWDRSEHDIDVRLADALAPPAA
jgi:hypothetical protein